MFAFKTKKTLTFGDDSITICKLSGSQIDKALEAKSDTAIRSLRAMGGELFAAMRTPDALEEARANLEAKKADKRAERLRSFDKKSVLESAIVSWSDGDVTPEKIANLDVEVYDKVYEEVIDLTYGTGAPGKD
jgi:hypothetical protein